MSQECRMEEKANVDDAPVIKLYSCYKCGLKKPKSGFYACANRCTGIDSACKSCKNISRCVRAKKHKN